MILRQANLLPSSYTCVTRPQAFDDSSSPNGSCDAYVGGLHNIAMNELRIDEIELGSPYFTSWLTASYVSQGDSLYDGWTAFAQPFSWGVWLGIFAICMILPLVIAFVELDDGETLASNYALFLPDSWHAIAGVDALKRSEEVTELTAWLSVAVAVVSIVIVSLYACNVASFVLYAALRPEDVASELPHDKPVFGPRWVEKAVAANSHLGTVFVEDFPATDATVEKVRSGKAVYVADEITALFVGGCSATRGRVGYSSMFFSPGYPTGHATKFNRTNMDKITTWMSVNADVLGNTVKEYKNAYGRECSVVPTPVSADDMKGVFVIYGTIVLAATVASFALPFARDALLPRAKRAWVWAMDRARVAAAGFPCRSGVICAG